MAPKYFVLSGPQGSGLSRKAPEIARLLGATSIVDEWDGRSPVADGALVITNISPVLAGKKKAKGR